MDVGHGYVSADLNVNVLQNLWKPLAQSSPSIVLQSMVQRIVIPLWSSPTAALWKPSVTSPCHCLSTDAPKPSPAEQSWTACDTHFCDGE